MYRLDTVPPVPVRGPGRPGTAIYPSLVPACLAWQLSSGSVETEAATGPAPAAERGTADRCWAVPGPAADDTLRAGPHTHAGAPGLRRSFVASAWPAYHTGLGRRVEAVRDSRGTAHGLTASGLRGPDLRGGVGKFR
jgi:hypothetical protein